jgi:hypothetical protein
MSLGFTLGIHLGIRQNGMVRMILVATYIELLTCILPSILSEFELWKLLLRLCTCRSQCR